MNRVVIKLLLGLAVLLVLGWYFSNISLYFVFSLVIAAVLRPMTNRINGLYLIGQPIPRAVAIFLSFSVVIALVIFLVLLFIPLFRSQFELLNELDVTYLYEQIQKPAAFVEDILIRYSLVVNEPGFLLAQIRENLLSSVGGLDIQGFVNRFISATSSLLISVLAISFITFFLLLENGLLRRNFIGFVPNAYFELSVSTFHKVERLLSNYLIGLLVQMTSIFSIASLGLLLMDIEYAMSIAVFAAVANLIPYAGPILGASFGILVGLSTGTFGEAAEVYLFLAKILGVFGVVQLCDNIILQPMIFSKSVKAHPLEIFVVIFAGAKVAGVLGMIFAIPVYTIFRVSFKEFYKGYKDYRIFKIDKI
ncbi:AI-2E family transporter [Lunatimonas lonarensis]|nr:AI-2E family transporter [Lunatimonas lonarensis]